MHRNAVFSTYSMNQSLLKAWESSIFEFNQGNLIQKYLLDNFHTSGTLIWRLQLVSRWSYVKESFNEKNISPPPPTLAKFNIECIDNF